MSASRATREILTAFGQLLLNPEIECLVYFSLADVQWRYGRLERKIEKRAIKLLDRGGDLFVWQRDNPDGMPARKKVLRALRSRLASPVPRRRVVRVVASAPKKARTRSPVGSLFFQRLPDGFFAALVLVGYVDVDNAVEPVFSALKWRGSEAVPAARMLGKIVTTIQFESGLGMRDHVAIIASDRRKNPISDLIPAHGVLDNRLPYRKNKVVFLYIEGLVHQLVAHFGSGAP